MSLRQRLLVAVAASLFASLALGTWITAWQMARMVRAELSVSLESGRRGVAAALQDMARPPAHDALLRLVAGFDGNQHVMAVLQLAGQPAVGSVPGLSAAAPPAWFSAIAAPHLSPVELAVPGGVIRLVALQESETGERWIDAERLIGLLALSAALAALFCFCIAAWSLRPLRPLADALSALERGQRPDPLAAGGPPEIVHLATAFNRMQDALGRAALENGRLLAQLDTLAEEERAELARDLHDDIGPLIFALTAWAAAARLQDVAGNGEAVRASLQSLESAAETLQSTLRDILRRLRDSAPTTTDLPAALADLLAFWRGVRPQTRFTATIGADTGALSEAVRAALFRVAQEGVSNAMRHATPSAVDISIAMDAGGVIITVQNDGAAHGPAGRGLGLIGLEERLKALGGTLQVRRGAGWCLMACAPTASKEGLLF
jgi:two-component system sensor histidine kinase UhpB